MYNGLARRVPVPQQAQQQAYPKTLPAATRGIIQNENPAFMKPAAAIFLQNWFPTQNTLKARGGSAQWCSTSTLPIQSMFNYAIGDIYRLFAANKNSIYDCTYTGTASTWAQANVRDSVSFIVELGPTLTLQQADRHAAAVLTVAGA